MTPKLATRIRLAVWTSTLGSVLLALLVAYCNDRTPLGMLLGFAPRWWATLPWLVLVPVAFWAGRQTGVVATLGAIVSLFGVAQFELPALSRLFSKTDSERGDIRVITYNTDISASLADRLRRDVKTWDADVILFQDCKTVVADSLRAIYGVVAVRDRYCVASRWPLLDVAPVTALAARPDQRLLRGAFAVRVRVKTPFGVVPVYSVHLPSPRDALGAARWPQPRLLRPKLEQSLAARGDASAAVSSIVSRNDAHFLVAGDFNLPYGSAILERDWGDLTNAFAHAGFGFGYTMQAGIFPVRIDHLFTPRGLEPIRVRVLSGYPSEHQPVVVDLVWKG